MTTRAEVHRAWAPEGGRWTRWVKPVLFSALDGADLDFDEENAPIVPRANAELERRILAPLSRSATTYREGAGDDAALVIDLPGAEGTFLGISLAHQGFRPIPLYNAVPSPVGLIDHQAILRALVAGAEQVAAAPANAAPAFLLDASRRGRDVRFESGRFDNRSVCRSSDFPSAAFLLSAGISRVIIVTSRIQEDLGEALLTWQREGIALLQLPAVGDATPFVYRGPSLLRRIVTVLAAPFTAPRWWNERDDGTFGRTIQGG